MSTPVAALFVRDDSIYKTLPGVDAWDKGRDALSWPGGSSVVAHPPCRAWGMLSHFARPAPGEKELALWAVEQVRGWGGVLEHPANSKLWAAAGLPTPGEFDKFGGWTMQINQQWWGHRALKPTFLYVVGCTPDQVPDVPFSLSCHSHVIVGGARSILPELPKAEREKTPPRLAAWLVDLARVCESRAAACLEAEQ